MPSAVGQLRQVVLVGSVYLKERSHRYSIWVAKDATLSEGDSSYCASGSLELFIRQRIPMCRLVTRRA
jgi:hypothetical protein